MTQTRALKTAYLSNWKTAIYGNFLRSGGSQLLIGPTDDTSLMSPISGIIDEGGFHELSPAQEGRYIAIYRGSAPPAGD